MTLTLAALEGGRGMVFLVSVAKKTRILRAVVCERRDLPPPAQRVQFREGVRIFRLDESADGQRRSQPQPMPKGES